MGFPTPFLKPIRVRVAKRARGVALELRPAEDLQAALLERDRCEVRVFEAVAALATAAERILYLRRELSRLASKRLAERGVR